MSLAGAVGWQRATGIDSFGAPGGDKDGYRNLSGRFRGTFAVSPAVRLGVSAIALTGRSQFDGFDPLTFERTDTLDSSRNRLPPGAPGPKSAARARAGTAASADRCSDHPTATFSPATRQTGTRGTRRTFDAQVQKRLSTDPIAHNHPRGRHGA